MKIHSLYAMLTTLSSTCQRACRPRYVLRGFNIQGEPSDRLNVVQDQITQTSQNYDRLKRLLRDKEFREIAARVVEIEARMDGEEDSGHA